MTSTNISHGSVSVKRAHADLTPAVIYARYSSHNQTEQSIEGQLHDAYAYAEREGYAIIGEYIDRAKTGKYDNRDDFQRMIADASKKQFSAILVWKLDRFARNRYDSAIYKARLKKSGVRVVSVMERIEDNPEGIILEGMLESMAEYYSANLSVNVKRGLRETISKGRFPGGGVPYGYKCADGHLYPDERTAPIIQEVFARYASGERMHAIVTDLNARGIRTGTGAVIRDSTFALLLRNPVFIGNYRFGGQTVPGIAEPLVSQEIFDRVQTILTAHKRAPAAAKAKVSYLLQGKLFCGHCGSSMVGESGVSKTGAMYRYYTCAARKKSHTCHKKNEKKDFVEWYVVEQAVDYIRDPERAAAVARAVVTEYKKEFGTDTIEANERRLRMIDNELNALVDRLAAVPASAVPRVTAKMEALESERAELSADTARLRIASGARLTETEVLAWLRQFASGDPTDPDFQRRVIDTIVNSVYLYDDRVIIFYNVNGGKQVSYIDVAQFNSSVNFSDEVDEIINLTITHPPENQEKVRILSCQACQSQPNPNTGNLIVVAGLVGLLIKRASE